MTEAAEVRLYQAEAGDPADWRPAPLRARPNGYTRVEVRLPVAIATALDHVAEAAGLHLGELMARMAEDLGRDGVARLPDRPEDPALGPKAAPGGRV
jgi:hypothetical protein